MFTASNYWLSDTKKYMLNHIGTLAWPVIVEMTCLVIGGVLTTAMVGRFGAVEVASVGLATLLQITSSMIIAAAGTGAGALVSRASGARDMEKARHIAGQTLLIGLCLSIVAGLFCYYVGRQLVVIASPDAMVVSMTSSFLEIMALFMPFLALINISLASIRAIGKTRVAMFVAVIGQVVSLITTYSLLFIFQVGVYGAILGMLASQVVAASLSVFFITSNWTLGLKKKHIFPLQKNIIFDVLRLATPAGLEQLAIQSGRIGFSLLMATAGAVQFAGHNVALQIESISFMPGMAFGIAAMTLVGQNLGRGLPHRAKQYAWLTCALGATLMGFLGIIFYLFAEDLTSFFITDPDVLKWGVGCVRVSALEQVFLALSMILPGVLRGSGDTISGMYVAIFGTWVIRMPAILLLKYFGYFNVINGWYCALLDITIRGLLFIYIVRKKDWQKSVRGK